MQRLRQLDPVHVPWHDDIGEYRVDLDVAIKAVERFAGILCRQGIIAILL
jgi:hypothetical protein